MVKLPPKADKVGSIILPADLQERSVWGKVTAVGPRCDPDIQVGMEVLFDGRADQELEDNFLMLNERDVMAVRDHD